MLIFFSAGQIGPCVYGSEALRHPPYLTKTERPRFIRAYYQLWGFMIIPQTVWQARIESMRLKELYHLCDISKLTQKHWERGRGCTTLLGRTSTYTASSQFCYFLLDASNYPDNYGSMPKGLPEIYCDKHLTGRGIMPRLKATIASLSCGIIGRKI